LIQRKKMRTGKTDYDIAEYIQTLVKDIDEMKTPGDFRKENGPLVLINTLKKGIRDKFQPPSLTLEKRVQLFNVVQQLETESKNWQGFPTKNVQHVHIFGSTLKNFRDTQLLMQYILLHDVYPTFRNNLIELPLEASIPPT